MVNHEVMRIVRTMSSKKISIMLKDVIQNMVERNNAEEIAAFLNQQCGGDDLEIARAYGCKKPARHTEPEKHGL